LSDFSSGDAYEPYVGRWSRLVAASFVEWLAVEPGARWLDVGCGTGALTSTVLRSAAPASVLGIDPTAPFVAHARSHVDDPRASFAVAPAGAVPLPDGTVDVAVSGLVLNFVPDLPAALAELRRVVRPGGVVAAYVWDYAGDMQLMRYFWDAAVSLDPAARELDEGPRFPLCAPDALAAAFASFGDVATTAITVPTVFRDFEDYWTPFLGGQGPAPAYAATLDPERLAALRESLRARLPVAADGTIPLVARAWAVRATRPL
jgi:SAM-dependent methyltransferase